MGATITNDRPLNLHGYRFEISVGAAWFELEAIPEVYGKTGYLSFYTDETLRVRYAVRIPATSVSEVYP